MIGGEPMPDRCELAETTVIPMRAVTVELLHRALDAAYACRVYERQMLRELESSVATPALDATIDDLKDALAAH